MLTSQDVGVFGEGLAAEFLCRRGLVILDRRWRPSGKCVKGELDVVARDGNDLVIVEVKTRRSLAFGSPAEAITVRKMRTLRSLALAWLDEHAIHATNVRFDVVAVIIPPVGRPVIEYLRGV